MRLKKQRKVREKRRRKREENQKKWCNESGSFLWPQRYARDKAELKEKGEMNPEKRKDMRRTKLFARI